MADVCVGDGAIGETERATEKRIQQLFPEEGEEEEERKEKKPTKERRRSSAWLQTE